MSKIKKIKFKIEKLKSTRIFKLSFVFIRYIVVFLIIYKFLLSPYSNNYKYNHYYKETNIYGISSSEENLKYLYFYSREINRRLRGHRITAIQDTINYNEDFYMEQHDVFHDVLYDSNVKANRELPEISKEVYLDNYYNATDLKFIIENMNRRYKKTIKYSKDLLDLTIITQNYYLKEKSNEYDLQDLNKINNLYIVFVNTYYDINYISTPDAIDPDTKLLKRIEPGETYYDFENWKLSFKKTNKYIKEYWNDDFQYLKDKYL